MSKIADLPPVAIRAVQEIPAPPLANARDLRQFVAGAGREEDAPRIQHSSASQANREPGPDTNDPILDQLDPTAAGLGPAGGQQFAGGIPSRDRKPCMCAAGALRGDPASSTATRRRALPRTSAAFNPAAPPPTTTTSWRMDVMRSV